MGRLLRASEVADRLGLHVITVYKFGRTGIFSTFSVGNRGIRFAESDVEKYLATHRINRGSTIKTAQ